MSLVSKLVVLAVTAVSLCSVACSIGQTRHEVIEYDPHLATAGLVCSSPFVKADLTKLTPCKAGGGKGTGKGHCYSRMKAGLDAEAAIEFADDKCKPDEVCVGDTILEANGSELKKCTFKLTNPHSEGRCMANLSKSMTANFALMKKGDTECDEDEACSPCIHPLTKEDTHICQKVGVHEKNCTEGEKGKQVELCCMGLGICMDKSSTPEGAGESLPNDSCRDGAQVCAPAALIDSKAEKCDVAGVDGVCLPTCFAEMVKGAQAGMRSSCNALSFCLPCAAAKLSGFDMPGCE